MKKLKLFSHLIIAMLAICALGTSCESDVDDVNVTQLSYTITFESNGGTVISDVTTNDGLVSEPTAPDMEGYVFEGWYSDESLETPFNFSSTIVGDVTLYAKWGANSYTVSFVTYEGDSENNIADQTVAYGDLVIQPEDPTREGYLFRGWYLEAETIDLWYFTSYKMGLGDMTLYAKWAIHGYDIVYYSSVNNDYDSLPDPYYECVVEFEGEITCEATEPEVEGYIFEGWYDNAEFSGDEYAFGDSASGDVSLYAKWEISICTVTFDTGEGTEVESQQVEFGSKATEPTEDPTHGEWTFMGWYTDDTYETKYDFDAEVTSNVTLYAKWSSLVGTAYFYSVVGNSTYAEYEAAPGDAATEWIEAGKSIVEPETPTDTEYEFVGWYTEEGFVTDTKYDFTATPIEDVILYAKWTLKTFTVTFYTGDGSAVAAQTVEYGGKATRPTENPTDASLTFENWYTSIAYTALFDFDNTVITANTTIYANWLNIIGTVSFYNIVESTVFADYATPGDATVKDIDSGTMLADLAPDEGSSELYSLVGWYTAENFDNGAAYDIYTGVTESGDIILYAKWAIKTFAVTFDADGGSLGEISETQTVAVNDYAIDPGAPTKSNSLFQGWYNNDVEFDFAATPITGDITLTAQWVTVDYLIYNEEDLVAFRTSVNAGGTSSTTQAALAANITLTETDWTPIGSSSNPFKGTFDGNNYTVSGLVINATGTSANYKGFFGCINCATIKNVTLLEPNVTSSHSGASGHIGGLIGGTSNTAGYHYIENCTVSGGFVTVSSGGYVGGIIGSSMGNPTMLVTNCTNDGTAITGGSAMVGGIIGQSNNDSSIYTNCKNSGTVTNSSTSTGGILGYSTKTLKFIGCSNTGTISGSNYVGGILGQGTSTPTFTGCYCAGVVTASSTGAGGIIGQATSAPSLIGCYNTGEITATTAAGGMIGYITGASKFYSCYNTGVMSATSGAGALFGSSSSAASGAVAYDFYYLDGDDVYAVQPVQTVESTDADTGEVTTTTVTYDNRSDTSGSTAVASIEALNGVVGTMNANTTFSATDYYYVAGDSTTPPTLAVK